MNQLILYSYRRCPFAIRARMVLEEKGISYTRKEENLAQISDELMALHPEGRVPLLVHEFENGHREVIYQSTVITEYLNEAFPGTDLMPGTALDRARVRLWTYWCDNIFKPDLDAFKYDRPKTSSEDILALETRLHSYFEKWDSALSETGYLVGKEMTLADIHLFPFARQFMGIKPLLAGMEKYSHLSRWLEKMIARPSFERVIAK